ncbi:MAG: acyl-CoA synthetase FdrA [Candidatus Korobacteraceae bacterium]
MIVVGQVKKGAYFDSVTLMQCGKQIAAMPGVVDAALVMGTEANRAILKASGLLLSAFDQAGDAELLISIKAETDEAAQSALASVDGILKRGGSRSVAGGKVSPATLEGALKLLPGANLALVSIAGRYAGDQAMLALENGLHVMLFSDNVPLEKEIELKKFASRNDLFVMGPDCGTAIINGVPLGFANVVQRGDIGIVAAAGTGLQEVSSIISNEGAGLSQAIGTGGRDVQKEVGGIMFLAGLRALAADEQTKVILLVSKPPHAEVLARITAAAKEIRKPVIPMFVGAASPGEPATLEQAALMAVAASRGQDTALAAKQLAARNGQIRARARAEAAKRKPGQKYVRGLFSGGTFCAEAQTLFSGKLSNIYSNVPAGTAAKLENSLKSRGNTLIDMGADEFTQGRLHPMIDYSLSKRRIVQEAADPETAVILLDVILGRGANPDPASELCEAISQASKSVCVVCSVTGTDQDPQNRAEVKSRLEAAGATVMPSNAAASQLAGYTIAHLEGTSRAQTV